METNAAKDLLEIVDRWGSGQSSYAATARGSSSRSDISTDSRREIDRAVALLSAVEAFADEVGDTDSGDRAFFKSLWHYIYLPRKDWAADGTASALDGRDRHSLKLYSRMMSGHQSSPRLDDAEVVALRGAIKQCLDLLEAAPDGVKEHREHVAYLLKRCLDILSGEVVDLIALQGLSFQAVGAAMSDGTLWEWDDSGTFFQNISVIARVWGPKVAANAAAQTASNLVLDGGKVLAQIGGTVVKGLIEAPAED